MTYRSKILIVDDISENLEVLESFLIKLDADIFKFTKGKDACTANDNNDFALAILDVQMPVMNGYELAENLRSVEKSKNLPIIFLSAMYSDDFHIFKGYESGAVDFITKPFKPEILISKTIIFIELDRQKYALEKANCQLMAEIKERKLVEEKLKVSQQKMMEAQEIARIASFEKDMNNDVVYISGNLEQLFNLDVNISDKQIDNFFTDKNPFILNEDLDEAVSSFNRMLINNVESAEIAFRVNSNDNTVKHISAVIVYEYDTNMNPVKYVVTFQDVTQQMLNDKLKRDFEVAEHTAEMKQQLLANLSHEIRTPIAGIIGMVDFLIKTELNKEQIDYLTTIRHSADGLINIINDILVLSKIDAGKFTLREETFNFKATIDEYFLVFKSLCNKKDIKFAIAYSERLPDFIFADQSKIKQVIFNLLSNAIKFTNRGQISLSADLEKKSGKTLTIKVMVSDTGIGIDEIHLGILFDKFTQIDSSLVKNYDGIGLGLAISKDLAELLKGSIYVESQPGKGSEFWFTFEAEEVSDDISDSSGSQSRTTEMHGKRSLGYSVLLADDKEVIRKVVGLMLKDMGCSVEEASNGTDVLRQYVDGKFDIIIMDVRMPELDGVSTVRELKKRYSNIPPVIALSADAQEEDALEYINAGMDDYLAKPVSRGDLAEKVIANIENRNKRITVDRSSESATIISDNKLIVNKETFSTIWTQASGDVNLVLTIYQCFRTDSEALLETLKEAAKTRDIPKFKDAIHTLKGLSGTIGASVLYDQCKAISSKISTKEYEILESETELMKVSFDHFCNSFEASIKEKAESDANN